MFTVKFENSACCQFGRQHVVERTIPENMQEDEMDLHFEACKNVHMHEHVGIYAFR